MADSEIFELDTESQQYPKHDTAGDEDHGFFIRDDAEEFDADERQLGAQLDAQAGAGASGGERMEAAPPSEFDPAALHVPEGLAVDHELVQDFGDLVGEMNLSQDQAQSLVDLQVKAMQAQESQLAEMRQSWRAELKNDPEYGWTRFEATLDDAKAVMRRFDKSGEVLTALTTTGFGDNPAIIKMLADIKRSISEDEFVNATEKPSGKRHLYDELWPETAGS